MKVILLRDVANLGQKGDVKEVKNGYARNFLFVEHLAKPATSLAIKEAENIRAKRALDIEAKKDIFAKEADKLKDLIVEFESKTNEQGGLFRAISKKQIASKLAKHGFGEIKEDDIVINEPIKKIGEYEVAVKRGEDEGRFRIKITRALSPEK